MLLYILLILGQAFASQDMALRASQCTHKAIDILKGRNTSKSVSLETLATNCIQNLGYKDKLTVSDVSVSGNMHRVKYNWGKGQSLDDFYAVTNTPCADSKPKANTDVKSFAMSLNDILNNHENSDNFNSCRMTKFDRNPYTNEVIKVTLNTFGFKKNGNSCKRSCPDKKILRGTRIPVFFTLDGKGTRNVAVSKDHGEMYLNVECVSCAQLPSQNGKTYNLTNPKDNSCYDSDGCRQGTEYLKKPMPNDVGTPSITEPSKTCYLSCPEGLVRGGDGGCEARRDYCEKYSENIQKIQSWKARFAQAVRGAKLGTCDMNFIKKLADLYAEENLIEQRNSEASCKNQKAPSSFVSLPYSLAGYLKQNYPAVMECLPNPTTSTIKINYNFYSLLTRDLLYETGVAYQY